MNIRRKIVDYLVDQQRCWHRSPNLSEIQHAFSGMTDDLDLHLAQLEREGLICLDKSGQMEVSVVATMVQSPQINVSRSAIPTAHSWEKGESEISLSLDLRRLGIPMDGDLEAMAVTDHSMLDAGFEPGDLVILRTAIPKGGDIVAVEINGQRVLRRYLVIAGAPHLLAENPNSPELRLAWEHPINGVYWGIIRVAGLCRTARACSSRKRISYTGAQQTPATALDDSLPPSDCGPAPSKNVKRYPGAKQKVQKDDLVRRESSEIDWPKPPSGCQLNESGGAFRTTESPGVYDTWGPRRTRKRSSKTQNP